MSVYCVFVSGSVGSEQPIAPLEIKVGVFTMTDGTEDAWPCAGKAPWAVNLGTSWK
jgi:hypothetical protein